MPPTMTREDHVAEFIKASGRFPSFDLVWSCLGEEFLEMKEAADSYHVVLDSQADDETIAKYRAAFVKEIADVQYVLSQLAIFYDVDLQIAFNRVAANNMTKVVDGKVIYREDGKILKPEGYQKPDMRGI